MLCCVADASALPEWFTFGRRSRRFNGVMAFDVTGDAAALVQLRASAIDDLPRIMDRFYLWTPRNAPEARQLLLDVLFELTAPDFSQIVHADQNQENIGNLVGAIAAHHDNLNGLRILDFGCGPGLSAVVATQLGAAIEGYDRCPSMRAAAQSRQLRVLTPEEFDNLPARYDAAFASYVFHLNPLQADVRRLWDLLLPDGVLVANFHKDYRLTDVSVFLTSLGARVRTFECEGSRFNHGSYRSYVRSD